MNEILPSPCIICGRPFRKDKLPKCPACGATTTGEVAGSIQQESVYHGLTSSTPQASSDELLKQILRATNKTTHAVRAFVRFLFIQLSMSTLSGLVILWGYTTNAMGLIVIGALTWLVGVIWSSAVGWAELTESNLG